jgi:hypothetical protein
MYINAVGIECSFSILEHFDVDFILGIDTLKGHNAIIDFGKNCLYFKKLGIIAKFLSDIEL